MADQRSARCLPRGPRSPDARHGCGERADLGAPGVAKVETVIEAGGFRPGCVEIVSSCQRFRKPRLRGPRCLYRPQLGDLAAGGPGSKQITRSRRESPPSLVTPRSPSLACSGADVAANRITEMWTGRFKACESTPGTHARAQRISASRTCSRRSYRATADV